MKYLVLVPDGCADEPLAELDGRTPLEAARMPHLAALAARGEVGRAAVIPRRAPARAATSATWRSSASTPLEYHTGRAPIEAAAMGVELAPDEVAYRCNLVTDRRRRHDGRLRGRSSDRARRATRSSPRSTPRSATVATACASIPASSTATCASCPRDWADAECMPPHDLTGQPAVFPTGPAAREAARADGRVAAGRARRGRGRGRLDRDADLAVGSGRDARAPALRRDATASTGRLSSAVDLVQGLGVLTGIEVVDVPGATAGFDNDYAAQRDACLASLADRDLFLLHVEATDEAGHQGAVDVKVDALERWDAEIIGPLVDALGRRAVPDPAAARPRDAVRRRDAHAPSRCRTCCSTPTPTGPGGAYTEPATAGRRAGRRAPR